MPVAMDKYLKAPSREFRWGSKAGCNRSQSQINSLALTIPRVMVALLRWSLSSPAIFDSSTSAIDNGTLALTQSLFFYSLCVRSVSSSPGLRLSTDGLRSLRREPDPQYYFIRHFVLWCVWGPRVNWVLGIVPQGSLGRGLCCRGRIRQN